MLIKQKRKRKKAQLKYSRSTWKIRKSSQPSLGAF
jgi:hypothetical protein